MRNLNTILISTLAVYFNLVGCNESSFSGRPGEAASQESSAPASTNAHRGDSIEVGNYTDIGGGSVLGSGNFEDGCASPTESQVTLQFDTVPAGSCHWKTALVEYRFNGYFTQVATLDLPEDAVVCELDIATEPGTLVKYDDFLIASFRDVVIGANAFSEQVMITNYGLSTKGSWIILDEDRMTGKGPYTGSMNSLSTQYCVEGADCVLPSSDKSQPLELSISSSFFREINAANHSSSREFALTVTGDNESDDCELSAITFVGTAKWYRP